jgi:hypothetical protein
VTLDAKRKNQLQEKTGGVYPESKSDVLKSGKRYLMLKGGLDRD